MSQIFGIGCLGCRQYIAAGQTPGAGSTLKSGYLYASVHDRTAIQNFLFRHVDHDLKFAETQKLAIDYKCADVTPDFGKL